MKIDPFTISISSNEIQDLQQRLSVTRWSGAVENAGWSLGMDSSYLKDLTDYWLRQFDWRAVEGMLNQVPHYKATIEGRSVHFVHMRSRQPNALPIVVTHGWPSTFAELLRLGDMLARPVAYGRPASQAFHVVIPSLPGYAFSSPPTALGTNTFVIAALWSALMEGLGYGQFIAHGGDIGAGVSTALGLRHSPRMHGVHLNFVPGSYQPHISDASPLSADETSYLTARASWIEQEGGYSHLQATKPDVLGPALNDSPVGLAAWIVDKFRSWSDCGGVVERRFTRDEILTTISLFWFTRSMPSAIRLYWENRLQPMKFESAQRVSVPVAFARFPKEIFVPPRSYVERGYNIVRWTEMPKGGHFAALEEPEMLADDIREFSLQFR